MRPTAKSSLRVLGKQEMRRVKRALTAACLLMLIPLAGGAPSSSAPAVEITLADLSGKVVHLVSQRYERFSAV
jgi:hypothetical protein